MDTTKVEKLEEKNQDEVGEDKMSQFKSGKGNIDLHAIKGTIIKKSKSILSRIRHSRLYPKKSGLDGK